MSDLDVSKLTPAPWRTGSKVGRTVYRGHGPDDLIGVFDSREDAEFAALARNAADVMERRGWHPTRTIGGLWHVALVGAETGTVKRFWHDHEGWADPFTALVEADKWYAANVESRE